MPSRKSRHRLANNGPPERGSGNHCIPCNKDFDGWLNLVLHRWNDHLGLFAICGPCQKRFSDLSDLAQHLMDESCLPSDGEEHIDRLLASYVAKNRVHWTDKSFSFTITLSRYQQRIISGVIMLALILYYPRFFVLRLPKLVLVSVPRYFLREFPERALTRTPDPTVPLALVFLWNFIESLVYLAVAPVVYTIGFMATVMVSGVGLCVMFKIFEMVMFLPLAWWVNSIPWPWSWLFGKLLF